MKKFAVALLAAGSVLAGAGVVHAGTTISEADHKFMNEAAQGGLAEVKLGDLAMRNAKSNEVKHFGKRMVADHTKANNELQMLAKRKDVMLPNAPGAADQKELDRLGKLKGEAFDQAYMSHMVKDHQNDIAAFKKEASIGKDSDIKAFAINTLPTLEDHLKIARHVSSREHTAMHEHVQAGGGKKMEKRTEEKIETKTEKKSER